MDNVNLYKEITLEIIKCLKEDKLEVLEDLFEKRQNILEKEIDNKDFKESMIGHGIIALDKNIKELLHQNMIKTKLEIQKHRLYSLTNNTYINNSQKKINIFNEKV